MKAWSDVEDRDSWMLSALYAFGGKRFYCCFDEGSSQSFVKNFFSVFAVL